MAGPTGSAWTHDPAHLCAASIERFHAARHALKSDQFVEALYLAGLAVECVLQALSHLDSPEHDARHDLQQWLNKCSSVLQEAVSTEGAQQAWSRVVGEWDNRWRYASTVQLLAYVRRRPGWRRLKGDDQQRLAQYVKRFVEAADIIHKKGLAEWERKTSS